MQHMTFAEVLAKYPDMTSAGLIYDTDHFGYSRSEVAEWRALLEASEPTFNAIVAWLDGNLSPAKRVTGANAQSAYALKHPVGWLVDAGYISRGVMESAMLACGYPFRVSGDHLWFGVCGVRKMRERAEIAMRKSRKEAARMANEISVNQTLAP